MLHSCTHKWCVCLSSISGGMNATPSWESGQLFHYPYKHTQTDTYTQIQSIWLWYIYLLQSVDAVGGSCRLIKGLSTGGRRGNGRLPTHRMTKLHTNDPSVALHCENQPKPTSSSCSASWFVLIPNSFCEWPMVSTFFHSLILCKYLSFSAHINSQGWAHADGVSTQEVENGVRTWLRRQRWERGSVGGH